MSTNSTEDEPVSLILCRPTPFPDRLEQDLADRYPGKRITAHVYDLETGCEYTLHPDNRQNTASVFKVLVMAGTLLEAQNESRQLSDWEWSQLTPMITESANSPVRALWRSFGASPWFRSQSDVFGLDETTVTADSGTAWGLTKTSARDQVDLLRQVLLGEWGPLEPGYRRIAVDLMRSVVEAQAWGVSSGAPDNWTVTLKNGFAGPTINSVGWLDGPAPDDGYVVAILTGGWPNHPSGIAVVEELSRMVFAVMTAPPPTVPADLIR